MSEVRRDRNTPVEAWIKQLVVVDEMQCWNWPRSLNHKGYGQIGINGKVYRTHRVMFEIQHGLIQPGMMIDHLCRNRRCCNPDHLRAVTPRVNSTENVAGHPWQLEAAKTHCPAGHPYDAENTYVTRQTKGGVMRQCKTCRRIRTNARAKARRAAARG